MQRSSVVWILVLAGLAASVCISPSAAKQAGEELSPFAKYLRIAGAKPVGSETCAECHAGVARNFQHAYHAQQGVQCEECHGNGSLHVDGGGDTSKIISFKNRSATDANGVCLSCHAQDNSTQHWTSGVHAANGVRCIDCHQVHASAAKAGGVRDARFDTTPYEARDAALISPETNAMVEARTVTNETCLKCHQTVKAQLSMPYHHPLREGKMSCVDCHDAHGGRAGNNLRTANVNELCLSCHAQYRGPFAYQHPPVTEGCLNCHNPHGSPNTNLLALSEPALCLQCHAGHHNGANLPVTDRCTNCHSSIHGTDVATPSGGSRFIDKGPVGVPSEPVQAPREGRAFFSPATSHAAAITIGVAGGVMGRMTSRNLNLMPGGQGGLNPDGGSAGDGAAAPLSALSTSSAAYRLMDNSGFMGRAGEYDPLRQSVGSTSVTTYVLPKEHLTLVSRSRVLTGSDYSMRSQLTAGNWLKAGLDLRSLVQQQDHYISYIAQLSSDFVGNVTDLIPANADFAVTRRIGSGYARVKLPSLPIHLFVKGEMQARVGNTQLIYLDENSTPAVYVNGVNTTCGDTCHQQSQYQPVNYTTRNIGGGIDVRLKRILKFSLEHDFSSFNDRLTFPTATYTGPFTPENEGFSVLNLPPSGPAPVDFPAGNYYLDIPSPNQYSADTLSLNLTPSERLSFIGQTSYTRLRNTFTHNPQNWFDSDETLNWLPARRVRLIADYHQQNLINGFTPYYSLYGNVSYHRHWEGLRIEGELPAGFNAEVHYRRSGITRSNSALWPQIYSMDNTDLLYVVPSSTSDTVGAALRYRSRLLNARLADDWTNTRHPGFLIVPQNQNRTFANLTFTPASWLVFSNDTSIIVQNTFPAVALPNNPTAAQGFGGDIAGLPLNFQRRDRFYTDAVSATMRFVQGWNLDLGYSYQQNNLTSYMAFQNDSSVNYVVDEPNVPYKQLSQVVWGDSTYTVKQRLGLDVRVTHNASSSGYRPDLNPNDAAQLGNAALIEQKAFDPVLFQSALDNLALSSTQISEVNVPQWIGRGKAYYLFPHKIEGGTVFYYGSYADQWNPNLNGVLRTFDVYLGRTW
ncbi:MAG: cytochrome c3 family protein [Terracidiphilus sp.]